LQLWLQIEATSPTHCESQAVLQQYASAEQMLVAQVLQVLLSFVPVEQIGCAQAPPPHDWPQIDATSPTHCESHAVVQQYESCAQMLPAQVSQLEVSFEPVEQIGCEQVEPPPSQVPELLQVWPLPQVPQVPPQPSEPQVLPVHAGVQVLGEQVPLALQVLPVEQVPQVPPQPSGPQVLPVHAGVQVPPPASAAPLGVPTPLGPSQPAPALQRMLPHEPLVPEVTSK
jgi:hypothetical protein